MDIAALTPWQRNRRFISTATQGRLWLSQGNPWPVIISKKPQYQDALREQQRVWLTQQARTADGIRIEIAANIAHSVEAQAAFGNGAEGVGFLAR
ncbi:putative PEP-binding protein [Escherichia coli]